MCLSGEYSLACARAVAARLENRYTFRRAKFAGDWDMGRGSVAGLFVMLWAGAAHAAWEYGEAEDPLDDTPVATMIATAPPSAFAVVWKCWKGKQAQMRVLTPLPYGDGSQWKDTVTAEVRIDKEEKFSVPLQSEELSGKLSLMSLTDMHLFPDSDIAEVLRALASAKQRFVIGLQSQVLQFKASKAAPAVKRFATRCGLDIAPRADDAETPELPKI